MNGQLISHYEAYRYSSVRHVLLALLLPWRGVVNWQHIVTIINITGAGVVEVGWMSAWQSIWLWSPVCLFFLIWNCCCSHCRYFILTHTTIFPKTLANSCLCIKLTKQVYFFYTNQTMHRKLHDNGLVSYKHAVQVPVQWW